MAKQTFTTGQVLTAAQMTSLQQTAMGGGSATAKTASYTLVAADAGTTVIMNSASATTITVNTSLFAAGDTLQIINQGAGTCTVTAGTATVDTASSLALSQYETGELYFLSASAAIFSEYTQAGGSGGMTLLSTTALTTGTTTISSISQAYKHLLVIAKDIYMSNDDNGGDIRFNGDTASKYTFSNIRMGGTTITGEATITTELSNAIFTNPTTNTATKVSSMMMNIYRYTETATITGEVQSVGTTNGSVVGSSRMPFSYAATAGITSISFLTNSGTFSGGNVYIYGVN